MSLEDLERLGVLVDNGTDELQTRVPVWLLVLTAALAVVGCVMMALGDGGSLTWIGLALFGLGLAGFIAANVRGVRRVRR